MNKPSEILKKLKKSQWTPGTYHTTAKCKGEIDRYCFNGFIFKELLGNPEPINGDLDKEKVYGHCGVFIHDVIVQTNDSDFTFTWKKKTAIQILEREGL